MPVLLNPFGESVAPSESDIAIAAESARRLAPALTNSGGTMQLRIVEPVTIPTAAFQLFLRILDEMANGNAVRLIPQETELTTQQAAELLNVSRPHLVRLLDDGRIPSHKVGTHRRVLFKDAMVYKQEHHRKREAALDRLTALDQELGLS